MENWAATMKTCRIEENVESRITKFKFLCIFEPCCTGDRNIAIVVSHVLLLLSSLLSLSLLSSLLSGGGCGRMQKRSNR